MDLNLIIYDMFQRKLQWDIEKDMFLWKIIMLLWARQIGKTTLIETVLSARQFQDDIIRFNGDNLRDRDILSWENTSLLTWYIEDKNIIFIDEAQKIENISLTLKLLVDTYKKTKQIIVTGSSSIHLLDITQEPLTGRKKVYMMYGISAWEIIDSYDFAYLDRKKEDILLFWSYPRVLLENAREEKIEILEELASANLYRDILEFQQIKNSHVLRKLLKLLALQIGKEVSMNKIAQILGIDMKTVERYIDLLEKSYIVFRLPPYFTNKKKEISKAHKIYFYDLGIRNTILNDFRKIEDRGDVWDLWENYLLIERMKKNSYEKIRCNMYFWRTYAQQEIDYIEEKDWALFLYEFKYSEKKVKIPTWFIGEYKNYSFEIVHSKNYKSFLI